MSRVGWVQLVKKCVSYNFDYKKKEIKNVDIERWQSLPRRINSNHVHPLTAPLSVIYTCATCISWRGAAARNNSVTGVWQTLPPSSSAPIPCLRPPLWSLSEELFPAQWHVDVYNGDGWWLALPHRGTDGLLPKRLSASLHQSPADSPPPHRTPE